MFHFDLSSIEGKPFNLGDQDCFTLGRAFYKVNFGIDIPNFSRPNDWDAEKDDLIENLHKQAGFDKLDVDENWPPRPADTLACMIGSSRPNHLVIFLGGNEIIHHKEGMISGREMMRPAWKRYTSYILRHPQVPDLTPKKDTMGLMEAYHEKLV